MRHFWENTLLFAKASTAGDGHQEYDSNIRMVGNNGTVGVALFRIWKNRRDWVLMVHNGENFNATEIKTFAEPLHAMKYAKKKYLDIDLPEGTYIVEEKLRVTVKDKKNITCYIGNKPIYGFKKEYREYTEYGGLKQSWEK